MESVLQQLWECPTEVNLWACIVAFQNVQFFTASGLPFQYRLKTGKRGNYTQELFIDRREKSKSLAWSSVCLAFRKVSGSRAENGKLPMFDRPKALGDLRGVSYIYPLFWRFGIIEVPPKAEEKMKGERNSCEKI